jgi:hypothetical protein
VEESETREMGGVGAALRGADGDGAASAVHIGIAMAVRMVVVRGAQFIMILIF